MICILRAHISYDKHTACRFLSIVLFVCLLVCACVCLPVYLFLFGFFASRALGSEIISFFFISFHKRIAPNFGVLGELKVKGGILIFELSIHFMP
jgi:hypothetical protein